MTSEMEKIKENFEAPTEVKRENFDKLTMLCNRMEHNEKIFKQKQAEIDSIKEKDKEPQLYIDDE